MGGALADASVLLGVPLTKADARGIAVTRWSDAVTPPSPAHRRLVGQWTKAVARLERIGLTGSWIAGTGLASVIPHAQAAADQLIAGLEQRASGETTPKKPSSREKKTS